MIFFTDGMVKLEHDEPIYRSCPECNPAHLHLLKTKSIHSCYSCGKGWLNGKFLATLKTDKQFLAFMRKCEKDGCKVKVVKR